MQPEKNCQKCPRLCGFRGENRARFPEYWNAPVPSFGELSAELLVVGLAPGLHGANQTGRPFTGDYAGLVLYSALAKYGFVHFPPPGGGRPGGGHSWKNLNQYAPTPTLPLMGREFELTNTRITNAVRCVPQENKPEPSEIKNCNEFLRAEIAAMPNLKIILSLGLVSHNAVLKALGLKASGAKFAHGALHIVDRGQRTEDKKKSVHCLPSTVHLFNSYHCSRYNINTGRLTQEMFDAVVAEIRAIIPR